MRRATAICDSPPMNPREELRARMVEAGLDLHADALLAMASDSIRLRPVGAKPRAVAYRQTPVKVIDADVVAIAAGLSHTLALLRDGSVLAWGANESGELGDGTRASRSLPGPVPGLDAVRAIAASGGNSLALQADGSVLVWGDHHGRQNGAWTTTRRRVPVPVEGLDGSVRALFGAHAIMDDGTVVALGSGRATVVPGLDADVVAVASGGGHGLAIGSDGSVTVWGRERDPADPSGRMVWTDPHPLAGCEGPIVAIAAGAAGYHQSLALTPGGEVLAWEPSPVGAADVARRSTPTGVPRLDTAVIATAVAYGQTFALRADGTVVAWGSNFTGDLGDGTLLSHRTPVPVSGLPPVQAIAPGAALTHDGAVYAWGGQLPPTDDADLEAQMPIGISKLGGCPDLPPDVPWPTRDARPMAFIAQVELGHVTLLDRDGVLPPAGLLSFFTLPIDWAEGSEAGRVIYTEPQTPLTRTPLPAPRRVTGRRALCPGSRRAGARRDRGAPGIGGPCRSRTLARADTRLCRRSPAAGSNGARRGAHAPHARALADHPERPA